MITESENMKKIEKLNLTHLCTNFVLVSETPCINQFLIDIIYKKQAQNLCIGA